MSGPFCLADLRRSCIINPQCNPSNGHIRKKTTPAEIQRLPDNGRDINAATNLDH